jgi:hypothetical protein
MPAAVTDAKRAALTEMEQRSSETVIEDTTLHTSEESV